MIIFLKLTFVCILVLMVPALSWSDETIEYLFFTVKPLMYLEKREVKGEVAVRGMRIFKHAGFKVRLLEGQPVKRIWHNLSTGKPNVCSAGWFLTDERVALGKYSKPIFQDLPQHVLAIKEKKDQFDKHRTLSGLLKDRKLILGVVNGFSYGAEWDVLIKQYSTSVTEVQRLRQVYLMLASARIDYSFVDPLERAQYLEDNNLKAEDFLVYNFPDSPPGALRHVVCSNATSDAVMKRLNHAVDVLGMGGL